MNGKMRKEGKIRRTGPAFSRPPYCGRSLRLRQRRFGRAGCGFCADCSCGGFGRGGKYGGRGRNAGGPARSRQNRRSRRPRRLRSRICWIRCWRGERSSSERKEPIPPTAIMMKAELWWASTWRWPKDRAASRRGSAVHGGGVGLSVCRHGFRPRGHRGQ